MLKTALRKQGGFCVGMVAVQPCRGFFNDRFAHRKGAVVEGDVGVCKLFCGCVTGTKKQEQYSKRTYQFFHFFIHPILFIKNGISLIGSVVEINHQKTAFC